MPEDEHSCHVPAVGVWHEAGFDYVGYTSAGKFKLCELMPFADLYAADQSIAGIA